MKAQLIREKFTNFFNSKNHTKIPSSPLVLTNDETLLFANAGMNQFKDYFTGNATPKNKKVTSIQKCVRAGGKHNDLENVGFTARHHTFFEMLGNFSFGDYFKKEAIIFAWDFITKELKIDPSKLYVTVHYSDDEARDIWIKDVGLSADRIFKKGDKDNFWEMGEVGPCGPCSEIFYDHGEEHTTPGLVIKEDGDILDDELRYVEIWNLVFMQYEKTKDGKAALPNPSIDTGMGLERIAAVMQGKYWNYDTDIFEPILNKLSKLSGKKYTDPKYQSSFRIIADHIRSSTMLITDGVIPSNEGRGYVLRRIIRRAVRHLKNLEAPKNSMAQLVPTVLETLGEEYPQNLANKELAIKFLELEESKFLETLDTGLKYLATALKNDVENKVLKGEAAFKLYDTYGFPLDLTEIIAGEHGVTIDHEGFNQSMQLRKEDSRKSWKGKTFGEEKIFHQVLEECGATTFTGYKEVSAQSKLLKILELENKFGLIFSSTPFYGESGGQVGDQGIVINANGDNIDILDTQKPIPDLHVHITNTKDGLKEGSQYSLQVNTNLRDQTAKNHSATHLLQSALIKILGNHVKQAGSLVTPDKLRFDFTHPQGLNKNEIQKIEELVNAKIQEGLNVSGEVMSMNQALDKGAMALFGEKYGDDVRVMSMGDFSTELCGGIHVSNTFDIGLFNITSEGSLSTGVRRIEAVTGHSAIKRLVNRSNILGKIEIEVSAKEDDIFEKLNALNKDLKRQKKIINSLNEQINSLQSKDLFNNPADLKGHPFLSLEVSEGSNLRQLSDNFMDLYPEGIILLTCINKGKLSALLRCSKKKNPIQSQEILRNVLQEFNGRGGGKPDMAQGSCDLTDISIFQEKVSTYIQEEIQA